MYKKISIFKNYEEKKDWKFWLLSISDTHMGRGLMEDEELTKILSFHVLKTEGKYVRSLVTEVNIPKLWLILFILVRLCVERLVTILNIS